MLKRPPSYSDSFLILGGQTPLEPLLLVPESPRVDVIGTLNSGLPPPPLEPIPPLPSELSVWPRRIGVFILKSSIHVFLISIFETVFFFYYVSVTENQGIVKTIDTYYEPIKAACPSWGNVTHWFLYEVLEGLNVTRIDSLASEAFSQRAAYNHSLYMSSLAVSGVCLGVFVSLAAFMKWKKVDIPWRGVFIENLMMVTLLGMYEYFFFRVIIYNYDTLSTEELNAHIADGLWQCVKG